MGLRADADPKSSRLILEDKDSNNQPTSKSTAENDAVTSDDQHTNCHLPGTNEHIISTPDAQPNSYLSGNDIAASDNQCNISQTKEDVGLLEMPNQPSRVLPFSSSGRNHHFQTRWYEEHSWLHFDAKCEKAFCFVCVKALKKKLVSRESNHDTALTSEGYTNWKKAAYKFRTHEGSSRHKEAVMKVISLKENEPVGSLVSKQAKLDQEKNCRALESIVTSVLFLARQGLAFRGSENDGGNFNELLRLRENDIPELKNFLQRKKSFTSSDIQNEILEIVSHDIIRDIVETIKKRKEFSLIVDETSDVAGKEQVSVNIRCVDHDTLNVDEFFVGLCETPSMTGQSLFNLIQDVLTRLGLSFEYLRGQCYDGGSNMSGVKSGVKARILAEQPLALYIHCTAHALNLALQDSSKSVQLIRDCLQWVHDVGLMIKDSPKRCATFYQIAKDHDLVGSGPRPLCPTRWTVREASLKGVLDFYSAVIEFLETLSLEKSECSSKARGLLDQLMKGSIFFGIKISHIVFSLTETLSCTLQNKTQTVAGAQESVSVVLKVLESKRSDEEFNHIWEEIEDDIAKMELLKPEVPRKRKPPKKLEYKESPEDGHIYESPKAYYRRIFYEFLDTVINEIKERFEQPGFQKYLQMEKSLLLPSNLWTDEILETLEEFKIDKIKLIKEKEFVGQLIKNPKSLKDFVNAFQILHPETKMLFPQVHLLLRLLLVLPATSATAERSFSMLRRLKTYLRSTMTQKRLNHVCILNSYPELVDNIDLKKIITEFIDRNNFRCQVFGKLPKLSRS